MTPLWIAVGICVLATAGLMAAEYVDNKLAKAISKPIASTAFIAVAVLNGAMDSAYGQAVVVALVFSWFGDIFLLSKERKMFLGGLVAFLIGHVGFGVAFLLNGVEWLWVGISIVPLLGIFMLIRRWLLPQVEGKMKTPVMAYMVVITVMVALAAGVVGLTDEPLYLVAATMFFVSDLAVARDRFVAPGFQNRAWGLPLYYGAQILFGFTVAL
jgi:uncharacterized membrane protein YhhN